MALLREMDLPVNYFLADSFAVEKPETHTCRVIRLSIFSSPELREEQTLVRSQHEGCAVSDLDNEYAVILHVRQNRDYAPSD